MMDACYFTALTILRYQTQLLGCDHKRLPVNLANEQVTPMPPDRWHAVSTLASAHAALSIPPNAGGHIRMPER